MKKKISILLALTMLLSGCNADKRAQETTTEITTTTTADTTAAATATAMETTAVTTVSVSETTVNDNPITISAIAPYLTDKIITVTAEKLVDNEKIRELYGYDFEIDEEDEYIISRKQAVEEKFEGEELEKWRSRNYLDEYSIKSFYVGNEKADWLINLSYGYYNTQLWCYENYLFIKDNEIVYETGIIPVSISGYGKVNGNDYFGCSTSDGILHIDLLTGEYDFIEADNWSAIADINEDYFIYGNGLLYVYDRINKEIIIPEVDINWCGLDSNMMELNGSRIEYSTYDDPETVLFYDIKTGESGKCDYTYYDGMLHYFENDEYIVKSPKNVAGSEKYDGTLLTITRKSDGLSKTFDMTTLPKSEKNNTSGYTFQPGFVFFVDDWFIPNMDILNPVAINFETEEAAVVDYQVSCHAYMFEKVDGRYFGRYWNENNEYQACEIFFELPETTAAAETAQNVKAENFDFNFALEDFTMDLSVFEKYFYGSWNEQSEYPLRRTFTYNEDSFNEVRYYCLGFYEDETGGYMLTMNGGVHELYFVLAASPDIMYTLTDFNIYNKNIGYCDIYKADENNSELSRELTAETLDSMGVLKLKADYGFDIKSFNSFTDPYGTEWHFDYNFYYYDNAPYCALEAEPSAEKIVFSKRYICKNEPHKVRRFISTAENQNGEWVISDTLSDFSDESIMNYYYISSYDGYISALPQTVTYLKNKEFEAEVNAFIEESKKELLPYREAYIEECKPNDAIVGEDEIRVYHYICNGYLSVTVGYVKWNGRTDGLGDIWYMCRSAVYDVVKRKKINSIDELFPAGFDYESAIISDLARYAGSFSAAPSALLAAGYEFTLNSIIFNYNPEFFASGNEVYLGDYCDEFFIPNNPLDFSDYVTCEVSRYSYSSTLGDIYCNIGASESDIHFRPSRFLTDEELAAADELVLRAYKEITEDYERHKNEMLYLEGTYFAAHHYGNYLECGLESYTGAVKYMYDINGDRLTVSDIVKENFNTSEICDCGKTIGEHCASGIINNKNEGISVCYQCGESIAQHRESFNTLKISDDGLKDIYK